MRTRLCLGLVLVLAACSGGSGGQCSPESNRELCRSKSAECGDLQIVDRCGNSRMIGCGGCLDGDVCVAQQPNRCEQCEPLRLDHVVNCGHIDMTDTCGHHYGLEMGECTAPLTCGGGGVPNQCGCKTRSDAEMCAGRACGDVTLDDGCGEPRRISCGSCVEGTLCAATAAGGCECGAPATLCTQLAVECGDTTVGEACGTPAQISCGGCAAPQVCGAWNVPNVCGCAEEPAASFCARAGWECGAVFASDLCGVFRSVDCGTCAPGLLCGAGGVDGRCEAPTCVGDGWCWENPLPQGETLNAIWGSSEQSAWAVGAQGMLRWNGRRWAVVSNPARAELRSIWGSAESDVWAVGADASGHGVMAHYDGTTWAMSAGPQLPPLSSVAGHATGGAWVVGDAGTRLKLVSGQWVQQGTETTEYRGVTVFADGQALLAGDGGLQRWDGQQWSPLAGQAEDWDWVWGLSAQDYWFSGRTGYCHVAGGALSDAVCNTSSNDHTWYLSGRALSLDGRVTWVTSATVSVTDVGPVAGSSWFEMLRHDAIGSDTVAMKETDGRVLRGLWGTRADSIWGVGDNGLLMHYDGHAWDGPNALSMADLTAAAIVNGVAWAGGGSGSGSSASTVLLRKTARAWERQPDPPESNSFSEIRSMSAFAGQAWILAAYESVTSTCWIVSHLRGGSWASTEEIYGAPRANAVAAVAGGQAWVAADEGKLFHYRDTVLQNSPASPTTESLKAIWGASETDVWAGGSGGVLVHFDGAAWTLVRSPVPATSTIVSLWGATSNAVWALAEDAQTHRSTPYRYDGTSWARDGGFPSTAECRALCGASAAEVWAVGASGAIARRSNGVWTASNSGTTRDFNACAAQAGLGIWVVGDGGAVMHHAP